MRLLLDTHVALWWLAGEPIGEHAEQALGDASNEVLLSAAVVWEVAIKRSLGKLRAPPDFVPTILAAGARPLAVAVDHAAAVEELPWHHRDPFDRMLVAQAIVEGAAIVSRDEKLRPYEVRWVW